MLTGYLNQHPRAAIRFKDAAAKGQRGDIVEFFDTLIEEE
jgi:hypothetical protein